MLIFQVQNGGRILPFKDITIQLQLNLLLLPFTYCTQATNTFGNWDKFIWEFGELHCLIWTKTPLHFVCAMYKSTLAARLSNHPADGVCYSLLMEGWLGKKRFSCRQLILQLVWPGACPYQAKCSEFSPSPKSIQVLHIASIQVYLVSYCIWG